jgi:glycine/D-amino acid oxidase-like deaminating enzyme
MTAPSRTVAAPASHDAIASTLAGGARVEVCIAGAGLAGMIAAYLLARERRSVMVIDEGPLGGPQIGAEVAQLAGVVESPYRELERCHGADGARGAAQGFVAAIDSIEAIVRRERIACEFERLDGYCVALGPDEADREVEAAAHAGMKDVERLDVPPVEGAAPTPCVRYPGQALLHPGKFVAGLARAISHEGGRIHCGVRTRAIEVGRIASLVTSAGHRVQADIVVTHGAVAPDRRARAAHAHVIGLRVPRGAVTRALYWDATTRRCARLRAQGMRSADVLLVAGRASEADDAAQYDALEAWAREHFPCAAEAVQRFPGETLHTADMFAFAGRDVADSESVYLSDASWGTAMTRAVIAGMVIRDFVEGTRADAGELDLPAATYTGASHAATPRELA